MVDVDWLDEEEIVVVVVVLVCGCASVFILLVPASRILR